MAASAENPELNREIARLKAAWKDLRLEMMNAAGMDEIGPDQWAAIARVRKNPADPSFRRELPVIIARFREAAQQEIMDWARRQERERDLSLTDGVMEPGEGGADETLEKYVAAYFHDIDAMNRALFGAAAGKARATGGLFKKLVADRLHMDRLARPGVHYISRLGGLAFEVMQSRDVFGMSDALRATVAAARADDERLRLPALQKLRDDDLLKPVPLGAVALLFGPAGPRPFPPEAGTLHASTPVPPEGVFSVLFRGRSYFPVPSA